MKSKFRTLSLIVLLLLVPATIAAQTHRASVRGTVYDPRQAAIPGASISVTRLETGEVRNVTTSRDGEYAITSLPAGAYEIKVEATGFKSHGQKLELLVNQELRLDIDLRVGGPAIEDEVLSDRVPLKRDSASLGTVIENSQITGLPLDGRNFYELSLLVPGAVPPAQGSAGSARGDFAFSVNGAREDANNFLLDGVYNIDPKLNTFGVRPSVDAIREFEMLTSTYDASFGRNPGAQVNVILNSGSNDFHGSLFEFHRNAALDARNFFAPAR